MRPARLATALIAAAVAIGLLQAPAQAVSAPVETANVSVQAGIGTLTEEPSAPSVAAPTNLKAVTAPTSVTISFIAPVTEAAITTYEYSENEGTTWVTPDVPVTTSPMTITGLTAGVRYAFSLRAVTSVGAGAASASVSFMIKAPKPPKPPRPVIFEVDGSVIAKGGATSSKVITLQPGVALKIREVPEGSTIAIVDRKDTTFRVGVRETNKARMWVTDSLPPARRLWVTVNDSAGAVAGRVNFKMARAERTFSLDVWPKVTNMGSGVPLVVDFGMPITNRAGVEQAMVVTSDKDFGEASWFWVNSSKAVFRPRTYWPGNATITLNANLSSVEGAKGIWGPKVSSTFKTGDQVILKANLNKHTMTYTRNGVLERSFKISGGKLDWETEAGVKVMTAHIPDKRLYNPDPDEGWDVTVRWAIRVNDNGEYIHDATWNYSIGYANTSHGCTNLTLSDMEWLWRNSKFGDIVEYTGSQYKIGTDDYLAGYWNYSWPEWKRGSALWRG